MPREIDCPKCKYGFVTFRWVDYDGSAHLTEKLCKYPGCKNGKITVYTEEELQDKIIIAVAKNSLTFEEVIKLIKTKLETMYTEEELQEALKAKQEECALICENFDLDENGEYPGYQFAETIRSKE